MKTKIPLLTYILCLFTIIVYSQPNDNPVRTYYGNGNYPVWTDNIHWNNVIDLSAYTNGNNAFEKFENARDELANQGGGVLYYPGGVYDFSDMPADGPKGRGLMLKENVVIRGEQPENDKDATDGTLELPTKFVFGFDTVSSNQLKPRDWNIVGLKPEKGDSVKNVDNVGVAWIHFIGAGIYFGANYKTYDSFDVIPGVGEDNHANYFLRLECWWCDIKPAWKDISLVDFTHPVHPYYSQVRESEYLGAGEGRMVFGCMMEDCAINSAPMDYGAGPDSYYTAKVAGRIGVYGSNVLVANNAMPKSDKSFAYKQKTCEVDQGDKYNNCLENPESTLLYDYGKMVGIEVNKSANGVGAFWEKPGYFNWDRFFAEENIIVKDNYVFNHGHKGYNISGTWNIIKNNHNERAYLKEGDNIYGLNVDWELTRDGYIHSEPGGSGKVSDNKSRAFDLGGKNSWIDSNTFNNVGSDPGNDGEGILCQAFSGTHVYSWAFTNNEHLGTGGDNGYIGSYHVGQYGAFFAWNVSRGWVGNEKSGSQIDVSLVDNDASNNITGSDVLTSCPGTTPKSPENVSVSIPGDSAYAKITWDDNSENEVAFRIDKKPGKNGKWQTVVYRPRKSAGSSYNKQVWRDYMVPRDTNTYYRVVAINCNDNDKGASSATAPVRLNKVISDVSNVKTQTRNHLSLKVSPNPTNGITTITGLIKPVNVHIYNLHGKKIKTVKTKDKINLSKFKNGFYILKVKGTALKILKK